MSKIFFSLSIRLLMSILLLTSDLLTQLASLAYTFCNFLFHFCTIVKYFCRRTDKQIIIHYQHHQTIFYYHDGADHLPGKT